MKHRSIPTLVRSNSRRMGPKPALMWCAGGTDVVWTWADIWSHAHTLALVLLDRGLDTHEPVLLWADDLPESLFAEVGIQAAGGYAVRLPLLTDPASVAGVADSVGARNLVSFGVGTGTLDSIAISAPCLAMHQLPQAHPGLPGTDYGLDPFSDDPRLEERLSAQGPDTPAIAILPPGQPDLSRGCVLVQQNLLGIGEAVALELGAGEDDSWLVPGPWLTAFPRTAGAAAAWLSGGMLIMTDDIENPLEVVQRTRPTIAVLPTTLAASLLQHAVQAIENGRGPHGRLARWALGASLRGENPSLLHQGLSMLSRGAGESAALEVLGGQLTRLVTDEGGPNPESVRRLGLFGASVWATVGTDQTSGVITLDRLPTVTPGSRLIPGTNARRDEDDLILVDGVSVSRQLQIRGRDDIASFVPFCRCGHRGSVDGDRVTWFP
jgi:acyl-CoA synthetase (AMP-forming)/AMP-acid ligase II